MEIESRSPIVETRPGLALPIGASLAVAVAAGVVWGLVQRWTDYEVGILAWAIGFAAGTAVVFASRGRRGTELQVLAVASALLGVLLGKYLGYAFAVKDAVAELGGEASIYERQMFEAFRDDLGLVFSWFDLLWVGFAVMSAWRIPRAQVGAPLN